MREWHTTVGLRKRKGKNRESACEAHENGDTDFERGKHAHCTARTHQNSTQLFEKETTREKTTHRVRQRKSTFA